MISPTKCRNCYTGFCVRVVLYLQIWLNSKGCILLSAYHCVFFLALVQILVGRLDSCLNPKTCQNVCLCYNIDFLKSQCKLFNITLCSHTCSKKGWLGGHFFITRVPRVQDLCICPSARGSLRAMPLSHFFMTVLLREMGL